RVACEQRCELCVDLAELVFGGSAELPTRRSGKRRQLPGLAAGRRRGCVGGTGGPRLGRIHQHHGGGQQNGYSETRHRGSSSGRWAGRPSDERSGKNGRATCREERSSANGVWRTLSRAS